MVAAGRTFADAVRAGTCYEVTGAGIQGYCPPTCETPEEAVRSAVAVFSLPVGAEVRILRHLPGSRSGCALVEEVGTVTVTVTVTELQCGMRESINKP